MGGQLVQARDEIGDIVTQATADCALLTEELAAAKGSHASSHTPDTSRSRAQVLESLRRGLDARHEKQALRAVTPPPRLSAAYPIPSGNPMGAQQQVELSPVTPPSRTAALLAMHSNERRHGDGLEPGSAEVQSWEGAPADDVVKLPEPEIRRYEGGQVAPEEGSMHKQGGFAWEVDWGKPTAARGGGSPPRRIQ